MFKNFQQYYSNLNSEQKQAVDATEGPVLMIAGPGSGKTHVIAMRIANIIKQTDTPPEAILALTFTDNAANNMKNRLVQLIGKSGYKVNIYTFHGFANELISRYPEEFIFSKELTQIDDLTRIKILQTILDENDFKQIKIFSSPYFYIHNIRSNISILKKEGFNAADFQKLVDKHQKNFDENKQINPKTGKLMSKWDKYEKQIIKNKELTIAYQQYEKHMQDNGLYDFEDMIIFVNNRLEANPDFLAEIRENYLYTLVDEYQDTNGAQNRLLMNIASFDDLPNLFAVGDEDQSIYSFQGANLRNILEFTEKFPGGKVITTVTNYRSKQSILNAANELISGNPDRFDKHFPQVKKQLESTKENNDLKFLQQIKPIQLINTADNYQENEFVVDEIKKLLEQGVPAEEIAVIYRNHADVQEIIDRMQNAGIAITTDTGNNILNNVVIQKVINLISYLYNLTDSTKLVEILHYDCWEIDQTDLYKLLKAYGDTPEELLDIMIDENKLLLAGIEQTGDIEKVAKQLLELKQKSVNTPLDRFYIELINELGILNETVDEQELADVNALHSLYDFIKSRIATNINYSAQNLIDDTTSLIANKLTLSSEKPAMYVDGVCLMTAHKAKGLEFDHVFIIKAIDTNWGNKRGGDKLKLLNLIDVDFTDSKEEKLAGNNEERRLFYVALTRARKQIFISFANKYLNPNDYTTRETSASMFLKEIDTKYIEPVDNTQLPVDSIALLKRNKKHEEFVYGDADLQFTDATKAYLKHLIDSRLKLSASALNAYLENPRKFLYQYILRVPKLKELHMILGTAIHRAIESYGRSQISKSRVPGRDELIKYAVDYLKKESLSTEDKKEITGQIEKIITAYYSELTKQKTPILAVEYNFPGHIYLDGIPLKGRIDAVEVLSENGGRKNVRFIDYKTSIPKSRNKIIGEGQESPDAGSYFRQLCFYALLAKLDKSYKHEVAEVGLRFLKPNSSGYFKQEIFEIGDNDLDRLKETIKQVWQDIQDLKFPIRV